MPGKVFISYSHKDEGAKDELQSHLNVGVMAGKLEVWEDRQIGVGDDWEAEIEKALNECCAAILLISRHFLSSGFINGVEVPKLLQRRQEEGLRLFPVVWSACDWKAVEWLPAMNMFPRDAKPMNGMTVPKRDEQFATFAEMVRRHIQSVENTPSADKEIREAREAIQAAAERVFDNAHPNIRPVLYRILEASIEGLTAAADPSKVDVFRIAALQRAMDREADKVRSPSELYPGLAELKKRVDEIKSRSGVPAELDAQSLGLIGQAREDVEMALNSGRFDHCETQLRALFDELLYTEGTGVGCLGFLSYGADLVAEVDRDCIEAGRIAIQVCIGLNLDKAPPLSAFRERLSIGGYTPVMVILPTGRFLMGSTDSDDEADDDEKPQHEVAIAKRFAIGRYSVTFEDHDHFCEAIETDLLNDRDWGRGRRSVFRISWEDACAYFAWLSVQVGGDERQPYRLASEAEWEYACRAGTSTSYPWGDHWDSSKANATRFEGQTTEVGSYPSNGWGLSDMSGNVREWCADLWSDNYLTPREQAPHQKGGRDRVVRGGSWGDDARSCRAACRDGIESGVRNDLIGFRLARSLD